jgi:hypothetical protein
MENSSVIPEKVAWGEETQVEYKPTGDAVDENC